MSSWFDIKRFVTGSHYDQLLVDEPNHHCKAPRRKPLGFFQKRSYLKEFHKQVPEFADFGESYKGTKRNATLVSAGIAGVMGTLAYRTSHQAASGLVIAAFSFAVFKHGCNQFFPHFTGDASKIREYNRAFNLWVHYTKEKPSQLPLRNAKTRLVQKLNSWKELHASEYESTPTADLL